MFCLYQTTQANIPRENASRAYSSLYQLLTKNIHGQERKKKHKKQTTMHKFSEGANKYTRIFKENNIYVQEEANKRMELYKTTQPLCLQQEAHSILVLQFQIYFICEENSLEQVEQWNFFYI